MGKLDESILYDALKHEKIQDHVDLEDDDKEFLDNLSKGIVLPYLLRIFGHKILLLFVKIFYSGILYARQLLYSVL